MSTSRGIRAANQSNFTRTPIIGIVLSLYQIVSHIVVRVYEVLLAPFPFFDFLLPYRNHLVTNDEKSIEQKRRVVYLELIDDHFTFLLVRVRADETIKNVEMVITWYIIVRMH